MNAVFNRISEEEEEIGKAIVHAAYVVHKELGPGLLEKVYEICFCHVLTKMGYKVTTGNRTSGPINAIYFDWKHGSFWGGSSNNGEDYGIGW